MIKIVLVFLIGFVVGAQLVNLTQRNDFSNIWPERRSDLARLNETMKDDDTDRMAMTIITQKQGYSLNYFDDNRTIKTTIVETEK